MIDVGRVAAIREHAQRRALECARHPADEVLARCWQALVDAAVELDPCGGPPPRRHSKSKVSFLGRDERL